MCGIRRSKGYTLIEVIIAMALFGIVLIVLCSILTTGMNIQKLSNNITKVNNDAAMLIEKDTGNAVSGTLSITFPGVVLPTPPINVNGSFYTGTGTEGTYRYFKPTTWFY